MISPYLIRIGVPEEDAVAYRPSGDGPFTCNDIIKPVTPLQKNEITCMIFKCRDENEDIGYHAHYSGTETFLCLKGKVEIIAEGRKSYMLPGDILHMQPFMGHAFRALEPDTWIATLFQGMDMIQLMEFKFYLMKNFKETFTADEAFKEKFAIFANKIDRKCPKPIPSEREDVFALRRPGAGKCYSFPGITLHEKVARYETTGSREFWEADVKEGAVMHFDELKEHWRLFLVNKGSVECTVYGEEPFTARGEDHALIRIPPYHPFTLKASTDCNFYDLDCPDMLGNLMEEIDPENVPTGEAWEKLKKNFHITCTAFEYNK